MYLAQGHSTVTLARLEPETPRSQVKDSDDEGIIVIGRQTMTIIIRLLQVTFCLVQSVGIFGDKKLVFTLSFS